MTTGVEQIQAERNRQLLDEHFDAVHDDEHTNGELIRAAENYALYASRQVSGYPDLDLGMPCDDHGSYYGWPWETSWWKPSDDPIRNLTKAGALIAAEIDRLQRSQQSDRS